MEVYCAGLQAECELSRVFGRIYLLLVMLLFSQPDAHFNFTREHYVHLYSWRVKRLSASGDHYEPAANCKLSDFRTTTGEIIAHLLRRSSCISAPRQR